MPNGMSHAEFLEKVDRGVREGVRKALLRHKLLGQSVVISRDGEIVELQPDEIPVSSDEDSERRRD